MSSSDPPSAADAVDSSTTNIGPSADSEITWLLHRAAQRMHTVTGEEAEKRGLHLRDYIVLSALDKASTLTQSELGRALGLDKTTLMSQLDGLERRSLVVRRIDPRDRRARIPALTSEGDALRAEVARACDRAERAAFDGFKPEQVELLRHMLFEVIGDSEDPGSCM